MERNGNRVEPMAYRPNYGLIPWIEKYSSGLLMVIGSLLIGWGIGKTQGRPGVGILIGLGVGLLLMALIIMMDRNRVKL
jgi:hypothetical protein